jgi:threonine dehydratase
MTEQSANSVVSIEDITVARERITDVVHRTPFDSSRTFASKSGAETVGLKLENMQRTGSFKIRGAYNAMAQLPPTVRDGGVIAASAGNHAQGVALAGQLLDIDTTIVVPEVTPTAKIASTRGYGAEVIVEGDIYERSYEHALELAESRDLEFIHAFNDEKVIAGQGTVGLELIEHDPNIDTVLVSVGGGGLISGIATAIKDYDPTIRVIGVQPEGAFHAKPSLDRGEIYELPEIDTVAEGIADTRLLEKTFTVMRERVDDVVAVSDLEMSVAVSLLAERAKTVAETAGAAPVAALLSDAVDVEGQRVAAVVSGGNVNITEHGEHTRRGLIAQNRYVEVRLILDDWPTILGAVGNTIEQHGGQIDTFRRVPQNGDEAGKSVPIKVGIEGSGRDHLCRLIDSLTDQDDIELSSSTFE